LSSPLPFILRIMSPEMIVFSSLFKSKCCQKYVQAFLLSPNEEDTVFLVLHRVCIRHDNRKGETVSLKKVKESLPCHSTEKQWYFSGDYLLQ